MIGIPDLPPRSDAVLGALPEPFRPSQADYLPDSLCWYDGSWLISANAWGDRRLARLERDTGSWEKFDTPDGWIRRPMAVRGQRLCVLRHAGNADHGEVLALRDGRWDIVAKGVEEGTVTDWNGTAVTGRDRRSNATVMSAGGYVVGVSEAGFLVGPDWKIPVPRGSTVTHLSPSPDRSAVLVVVRVGGDYQGHVFSLRNGQPLSRTSLRRVLLPTSAWLDDSRIVVVVEDWPRLAPLVWDWKTGDLADVWVGAGFGTVRAVATGASGGCAVTMSTPDTARAVRPLEAGPDAGSGHVRPVIVERAGQSLPCLVHEALSPCRGTAFFFPGGPHEPVWGEYAPLALAMNELGWRVVRANTRASGLRQARYRPRQPVRYGTDDVADACAIIEALADGPVVTSGMSYGAYLATRAGELSDRCTGIASLSGFLHHDDLSGSGHDGVRRFTQFAWRELPPAEPADLTKRYFLAHGDLDRRIPIAAIERHLSRMKHTPTFVRLDGEGHALHSDRGARLTYPAFLNWLHDIRR